METVMDFGDLRMDLDAFSITADVLHPWVPAAAALTETGCSLP